MRLGHADDAVVGDQRRARRTGARREQRKCNCDDERAFHGRLITHAGASADSTFAMNRPIPVPRISPSMASSTAIGTNIGVYVAASTGAEATPPICASDEMPHS